MRQGIKLTPYQVWFRKIRLAQTILDEKYYYGYLMDNEAFNLEWYFLELGISWRDYQPPRILTNGLMKYLGG